MNREDAVAIMKFTSDMIAASLATLGTNTDTVKAALGPVMAEFMSKAEGTPGTGACMCQHNPEQFKRMWGDTPELLAGARGTMILDHRCPQHGEKAQPALWGRHKDKQLGVTWKEWTSLGVTRT